MSPAERESCHAVELTIDRFGVDARWFCSAEVGAPCRLTCPEGCEEWNADHSHTLVDAGRCLVVEWLENDAWDESYSGDSSYLHTGPIFVQWNDPGYVWSYDPFEKAAS